MPDLLFAWFWHLIELSDVDDFQSPYWRVQLTLLNSLQPFLMFLKFEFQWCLWFHSSIRRGFYSSVNSIREPSIDGKQHFRQPSSFHFVGTGPPIHDGLEDKNRYVKKFMARVPPGLADQSVRGLRFFCTLYTLLHRHDACWRKLTHGLR